MSFDIKNIKRNGLSGILLENPSYDQAHEIWKEAANKNENIFLSWIWIGPWLELVQNSFDTNLFVIYKK